LERDVCFCAKRLLEKPIIIVIDNKGVNKVEVLEEEDRSKNNSSENLDKDKTNKEEIQVHENVIIA